MPRPLRSSRDAALDERVRRYLGRPPPRSEDRGPSVFWERQLEAVRASSWFSRDEPPSTEDLEAILSSLGYGFEDLAAQGADGDPRYLAARSDAERMGRIAKTYRPAALELTSDGWEHASALAFLARRGAIDEYLALLNSLRVRSSMSVARHYWYARQIRELAAEHAPGRALDIVEIGAGAGNLAVLLQTLGLVRSYVIVDLPELLVHSAYTLTKYMPGVDLHFEAPSGTTTASPSARFSLLTPEQACLLPDDSADLALNFNSFMEMDRDVRDGYLELVYRVGRPGSLFVNVNRRQRALPGRDGVAFDNNPLLYPYRGSDRVLLWEEDEFQTVTRVRPAKLPSLAIVRAALLVG